MNQVWIVRNADTLGIVDVYSDEMGYPEIVKRTCYKYLWYLGGVRQKAIESGEELTPEDVERIMRNFTIRDFSVTNKVPISE